MTKYLKVNNAVAQLGLGPFDNGTREDLIKANPDIIFIPSVAYTSGWHYASNGRTALF